MKKFALISLRNDLILDRDERRDSIDIEIYNLVLDLGYSQFFYLMSLKL